MASIPPSPRLRLRQPTSTPPHLFLDASRAPSRVHAVAAPAVLELVSPIVPLSPTGDYTTYSPTSLSGYLSLSLSRSCEYLS